MRFSKDYEAELLARADKSQSVTQVFAKHVVDNALPTKQPASAGVWTFRIPNWTPTPLNKILYGRHWTAGAKHKQSDAEIVAHYGRGVPKASQQRAVSLHVVFPPGKRMPDVDAYAKSLLDALVHCGLLVNDSSAWCVLEPVQYSRGGHLASFITLQDL